MKQDKTLKELYEKYKKPDMTRAERQELMETIYRERYKQDPRKPITQKGQALLNLVFGAVMTVESVLELTCARLLGSNGLGILSMVSMAVILLMIFFEHKRKKEPADEMTKTFMLKAASLAAVCELTVMFVMMLAVIIVNNARGINSIVVNCAQLFDTASLLLGVYMTVRFGAYLWLDRAPACEEE